MKLRCLRYAPCSPCEHRPIGGFLALLCRVAERQFTYLGDPIEQTARSFHEREPDALARDFELPTQDRLNQIARQSGSLI